ncbi:hypothetical protein RvY_11325 [Ramazzottius varieornatus]|uniref:Ubiquitin-conjugating enzyme E2 Z n=1 Tax=Ramazzottius varieornatus TaxID=947166 RepID=A0A1D1VI62_RAMVA|nr:hypothetical protein RvY_11325 [Ramazzottius varieornatus]
MADEHDYADEDYEMAEDGPEDDDYFPFDDDPVYGANQADVNQAISDFNHAVSGSSGSINGTSTLPSVNLPAQVTAHLNSNMGLPIGVNANTQVMSAYEYQTSLQAASAASPATTTPSVSNNPFLAAAQSTIAAAQALLHHAGLQPHSATSGSSPGSSGSDKPTFSQSMSAALAGHARHWDPSSSSDWDATKPSDLCLGRVARDIHSLYTDTIPGIVVHANENDITRMLALIKGPEGTPYDGGYFQFYVRCPPDYPISSPRVRLLTTGDNTVRFNPNLYANGKVCLSLLGTWSGPQWSPALNISSLLLSIQSLMCEHPYRNEPGFEKIPETSKESLNYNLVIRHETLRVAVISQVSIALGSPTPVPASSKAGGDQRTFTQPSQMPEAFRQFIFRNFLQDYDKFLKICGDNKDRKGKQMPSSHMGGVADKNKHYDFDDLANKITALKPKVEAALQSKEKPLRINGGGDN